MNENVLGIIAGLLTSGSMIPQLVKVIKEKNADDLSSGMLIVLISGVSLWIWYGFLKDELPIILTNAFSVVVNVTLLIYCLIYKNK
ncbi:MULTISPECIES: SemiSWEET transporter [Chryseobacterium]|jgi:MtN3 and saliva related transmembrane protein|uniref:SemiSWEET transporter n=1 Tax=Chryseobacterium gambrini TaxID=373672 RepID=A0ABM8KAQ2_9FLAO|nr:MULTISPECIES: SemiSWEET transporter [Chryseobacterium]MCQ4140903.1 SemiSWEET transporter [Chryseobacterium sp. EO14]MCY1660633.1 SemiSWEET transporter [Chryseobacterium sp. SL1]WBX96232.1 SemiSWEET transporter [Chryseobacterium gambrini]BEV06131.1 SemiSWEET transporter [Chryseobacterium gambrini]